MSFPKYYTNARRTEFARITPCSTQTETYRIAWIDFKADGTVTLAGSHSYEPSWALTPIECQVTDYVSALRRALNIQGHDVLSLHPYPLAELEMQGAI
jgi:hypothetical protein